MSFSHELLNIYVCTCVCMRTHVFTQRVFDVADSRGDERWEGRIFLDRGWHKEKCGDGKLPCRLMGELIG